MTPTRIVCVMQPSGAYVAFLQDTDNNAAGIAHDRDGAVMQLMERIGLIAVRDLAPLVSHQAADSSTA